MIVRWILKSAWHRRWTTLFLTILFILSVGMLSWMNKVSNSIRSSFEQTVSGTDLIVGARAGNLEILLGAVFYRGGPLRPVSYSSYQKIKDLEEVQWAIPISLGDSHRGFPVVASEESFFDHYRYGRSRAIGFSSGISFGEGLEVVLGAETARKLNLSTGEEIFLSHGQDDVEHLEHKDHPFTVVGIMKATGTPLDSSVLVSLESLHTLHEESEPGQLSAIFVQLKSPTAVFKVQQDLEHSFSESLSAVLPGMALRDLWSTVQIVERSFQAMSYIVLLVSLLSLVLVMIALSSERQRELALWRAQGANKRFLVLLLSTEAFVIALIGSVVGVFLSHLFIILGQPLMQRSLGILVELVYLGVYDVGLLVLVPVGAMLVALWPSVWTYRNGLARGLQPGSF